MFEGQTELFESKPALVSTRVRPHQILGSLFPLACSLEPIPSSHSFLGLGGVTKLVGDYEEWTKPIDWSS